MTDSRSRLRVVFLGFCQTESDFRRLMTTESGMPTQTQKFGWAIVHALESAGCDVTIVSAAPATDWPTNRRVLFRGVPDLAAEDRRNRRHAGIGFINVLGAKHATRYVSARQALRRIVEPDGTDVILVHGVHSPFLHAAVQRGKWTRTPVCVVLTDAPTQPGANGRLLNQAIRGVDWHLIRSALQRVDAAVALTQPLAEDFVYGRPYLLMEGIARELNSDPVEPELPNSKASQPNHVVYAGGLSEEYGVGNLLTAATLSGGSWQLHLYGRGPLEGRIRHLARTSESVRWGGLADDATLAQAYRSADLLINPRPVELEFVRYSFPSKLLEYLAAGRPVMTTRLPSIPAEYEDGLLFMGDGATEISRAVEAFISQSPGVRAAIASRASALARAKGEEAQGERLATFLATLVRKGGTKSDDCAPQP